MPVIHILPEELTVEVGRGTCLLEVLRTEGISPDAPCGGQGKCGKCVVLMNGKRVLACQTSVETDMTVTVPEKDGLHILREGVGADIVLNPVRRGYFVAIDIGTTSVVTFLLDRDTGRELASASMLNPQTGYGADVISRIKAAMEGSLEKQRDLIRGTLTDLISRVCGQAGISPMEIGTVAVVGNPSMQQLFLGLSVENLAGVPFAPVLLEAKTSPCRDVLPICENAVLLTVPDIAGYIGADTMGCVLSTEMYASEPLTLMVDIGTNGELVLGSRERMIACSTAAGPALEGANIRFGMRGTDGAIDHVWMEEGRLRCSVIGGGTARGICGSGLIDAVAVLLDAGILNKRGRIQSGEEWDGQRAVALADRVWLTQEDIRQVQMAKGAICAGVRLMVKQLGREVDDIQRVLLAGAFGSYMSPESACRIGLLPEELRGRITAVGNAAGRGAKLLACNKEMLAKSQILRDRIEFLELASLPEFSRTFAMSMNFREVGV